MMYFSRILLVSICFLLSISVVVSDSVQADLFVRRDSNPAETSSVSDQEKKKSFFSRIFNIPGFSKNKATSSGQASRTDRSRVRSARKRPVKDFAPIDVSAAAFYKMGRNVSPALLRISGEGPQTTSELLQVAAALSTPNMARVLELRRKNRKRLAQATAQRTRQKTRMTLLNRGMNRNKPPAATHAKSPSRRLPVFVPKSDQTDSRPSRVFTDFQ